MHAGNLPYSFGEDRKYPPPAEKDMARVGRPLLQRQEEVVQGEAPPSRPVMCVVHKHVRNSNTSRCKWEAVSLPRKI